MLIVFCSNEDILLDFAVKPLGSDDILLDQCAGVDKSWVVKDNSLGNGQSF